MNSHAARQIKEAHSYEVRPRKDRLGVDLISTPDNAIGYAHHYSRSHDTVIRVYDATGGVIETHEHAGKFKRGVKCHDVITNHATP